MKYTRRIILGIFAVGIAVMLGYGMYTDGKRSTYKSLSSEEFEELYKSEENGFHTLQRALDDLEYSPDDKSLEMLYEAQTVSDVPDDVKDYLRDNDEAITLARSSIESGYILAPRDSFDTTIERFSRIRELGRAFGYRSRMYRVEENYAEALEIQLDAVRIWRALSANADTLTFLVLVAVDEIAYYGVHDLIRLLNAEQLVRLIEELAKFRSDLVPFEQIKANDLDQTTLIESVIEKFQSGFNGRDTGVRNLHTRQTTVLLGTELRARVRLYELEHEMAPETLAEAMGHLDVPIDPVTGNAFEFTDDKIFSRGERFDKTGVDESSEVDLRAVF